MRLSKRAMSLQPSATLAIAAKAKKLRAEGVDVIDLGVGEPDFATPPHIVEAAVKALSGGDTHYTPVGGSPAMKKAIIAYMKREYGLDYSAAEVFASCGAKHTLYNIFMSIVDPGDEVIIPAPFWVSYPEQVALAEGVPVIAPSTAAEDFLMSAASLEKAITPRTKALILNSPSNPTGGMYDKKRLGELAEVIGGKNIIIVCDDIYHKLVYDGRECPSILNVAPALRDRAVVVNGVSKSYAMTGWRIGFAAGPAELIGALDKMQGQATSNPTSFAQAGAIEALSGDQKCIEEMRAIFDRRRRLIVAGLNAIPKVSCALPPGAFYAFPTVSGYFGAKTASGAVIKDSMDLASFL
ncbi:pyridoxal phosphate-dependent aminotransferase, partial [bacterium]